MGVKMKMEAPNGPAVVISGLDDIMHAIADAENVICKYEKFAEDVILSCAMPEIPRYSLSGEGDKPEMIGEAEDLLHNLLVRYRRMTEWFRKNSIDVDAVVGDGCDKKNRS